MRFKFTSNFISCFFFSFFFLSFQDEFKKEKGEGLTQILCEKEEAEADAGASVCSLLLAQSEVRPECLLMVLANSTGKGHFGDLELTRAELKWGSRLKILVGTQLQKLQVLGRKVWLKRITG